MRWARRTCSIRGGLSPFLLCKSNLASLLVLFACASLAIAAATTSMARRDNAINLKSTRSIAIRGHTVLYLRGAGQDGHSRRQKDVYADIAQGFNKRGEKDLDDPMAMMRKRAESNINDLDAGSDDDDADDDDDDSESSSGSESDNYKSGSARDGQDEDDDEGGSKNAMSDEGQDAKDGATLESAFDAFDGLDQRGRRRYFPLLDDSEEGGQAGGGDYDDDFGLPQIEPVCNPQGRPPRLWGRKRDQAAVRRLQHLLALWREAKVRMSRMSRHHHNALDPAHGMHKSQQQDTAKAGEGHIIEADISHPNQDDAMCDSAGVNASSSSTDQTRLGDSTQARNASASASASAWERAEDCWRRGDLQDAEKIYR
jgi:hypothetical protein